MFFKEEFTLINPVPQHINTENMSTVNNFILEIVFAHVFFLAPNSDSYL